MDEWLKTRNLPLHFISVAGLVYKGDEVLLIKSKRRGWEIPGGVLEQGEDIMSGLKREIFEESGIVAEPEEGKIYKGVITKIMDFGAFVKFVGSTEGLVHISEVKNERIASVSDFYKEGDSIWVKCLGMDNRGKFKLSAKRVNQETGEDLENAK